MSWLTIIAAVVFPNIGGLVGVIFTKKSIPKWYNKQLKKPSWRPPNWAFGPAWTYLYSTMGYASYCVWVELEKPDILALWNLPPPIKLFFLQILLNWLWTPIFFGLKHITLALAEILLLDVVVVMTVIAFWEVDSIAGILLIPYVAWLSLATALTFSIWMANPEWRFGYQTLKIE